MAAPPPPVLAPRYRQFAKLFSDPSADPCHGRYQRLMQRFAGGNNQVVAARLMDQSVGSAGSVAQAFLCASNFRIFCIHSFSRYHPAFDGSLTPWDNQVFAFLGDVTANCCCTSVRIPPDIFLPIQVRAFTTEHMRNNIVNVNPPGVFEHPQDHTNTTEVITRGIIPLPGKYAALFLRGRGYTPREMWDQLVPLIFQDNLEVECAPCSIGCESLRWRAQPLAQTIDWRLPFLV
jgi:hypothetical protein